MGRNTKMAIHSLIQLYFTFSSAGSKSLRRSPDRWPESPGSPSAGGAPPSSTREASCLPRRTPAPRETQPSAPLGAGKSTPSSAITSPPPFCLQLSVLHPTSAYALESSLNSPLDSLPALTPYIGTPVRTPVLDDHLVCFPLHIRALALNAWGRIKRLLITLNN